MAGEQFSMDTLQETRVEFELGVAATGNIEPGTRELDRETLALLEQDVVGSRFDILVAEGYFLPCSCIDGRCPGSHDVFNATPNAAGGTLTLLVSELLTDKANIASTAQTSEEALASLIAYLQTTGNGDQIGGHTGPVHGPGAENASGCGANDALLPILGQMVEKGDVMRAVLQQLGVDDASLAQILADASALYAQPDFFATGKTVADTLQSESPDGNCPALVGAHNEVLIRLNTVEGTTIDRRALQAEYGDDYQIFNVDVWALRAAAETLAVAKDMVESKFTAMVVYQVATALQLCGPSMKVIVR